MNTSGGRRTATDSVRRRSEARHEHGDPNMIRITFRHAFDRSGNRLRGQFAAILGDQQLCVSSNPFQAAASVLINAGYDPTLLIAGRPAEANFDAMTSTTGEAAPARKSAPPFTGRLT